MKKVFLVLTMIMALAFVSCEKDNSEELQAVYAKSGNSACTFSIGTATYTIWWKEGSIDAQLAISSPSGNTQFTIPTSEASATCNEFTQ
jgi:hypothetical protein